MIVSRELLEQELAKTNELIELAREKAKASLTSTSLVDAAMSVSALADLRGRRTVLKLILNDNFKEVETNAKS